MESPTLNNHYEGRFTPEVEQILREAGWFPGRVVSDEQASKWLTLEQPYDWPGKNLTKSGICQVRMFPAAWRALQEFGGLSFKQKSGDGWRQEGFTLDPIRWMNWIGGDGYFLEEWIAGGALFPIGYDEETPLMITRDGKVIDEYDNFYGHTIEEALTNLVLRERQEYEYSQSDFHDASVFLGLVNTMSLEKPYAGQLMQFEPQNNHYKDRFSPEIEQALRKAGWFPGRVVSNQQALKWLSLEKSFEPSVRHLSDYGIAQARMFPAAWRALREFGGLTFREINRNQLKITIDPLEGMNWLGSDNWFWEEWCSGGALFPIGCISEMPIAITGDGKVIDHDDTLFGNTIEEALTNLILLENWQTYEYEPRNVEEAYYLLGLQHRALYN